MKPETVLIEALQDVIVRSFDVDAYKIRDIREIAQKGLNDYREAVPKSGVKEDDHD